MNYLLDVRRRRPPFNLRCPPFSLSRPVLKASSISLYISLLLLDAGARLKVVVAQVSLPGHIPSFSQSVIEGVANFFQAKKTNFMKGKRLIYGLRFLKNHINVTPSTSDVNTHPSQSNDSPSLSEQRRQCKISASSPVSFTDV